MAGQPWYAEGLRFTCTECGDCCTGAPGFVWVSPEEIRALAAHLQLDIAEFEAKYVHRAQGRKSLVELPNYDCVFLSDDRKCTVYEARPQQCRTWPFWDSNLKSPTAWKHTCEVCPGSGQGKLHTITQIETQARVVKV